MIQRFYNNLENYLQANKVLILYGPRRVGKTTLLRDFLRTTKKQYRLESGDNVEVQDILSSRDFSRILEFVEGHELIALDEAQNIPNVGMGLKIIVDQVETIYVIATGSSSFDLANRVGEPLTGRKRTLVLYPLSQLELLSHYRNRHDLKRRLESFLVFGSYPEALTASTVRQKREVLEEIVNSYLLKDVLALERVKGSKVLMNLLRLLAFQVGSEVSLHELGTKLGLDVKTVDRYLDLLEKTFVIVSLGGFSRNLRKEISRKFKFYFLDTGIRNAVISQFNALEKRNDVGQLWENFIICERIKKQQYTDLHSNNFFWRTYDKKEIDWIEERDGRLYGFEIKWGSIQAKSPKGWLEAYPEASFEIVNQDNYLDFVT